MTEVSIAQARNPALRRACAAAAALVAAGLLAVSASGQDQDDPRIPPDGRTGKPRVIPSPELRTIDPRLFDIPGLNVPDQEAEADEPAAPEEPPLSREERMDNLFAELAAAATEEEAAFIAEEVEALWRDSGSATVDLLTDRATDALEMGDATLARDLINGALELGPEHAEAWAESARIALVEDELGIALEHIERAVSLEPRHYYALTELGIILERLEAAPGAYEAYQRALALNPRLPEAVAGAERTRRAAEGREL